VELEPQYDKSIDTKIPSRVKSEMDMQPQEYGAQRVLQKMGQEDLSEMIFGES
jgi:hypothetical protein